MTLKSSLKGQLTRFAPGSFREYMWVSFPLMLSMMSRGLMFFVDRLVMAKYSTSGLNALTASGTCFAVITFAIYGITGIAQVFSAQYNGAGEYKKVSQPIWQMIWFSFFVNIITIPMAFLLPKYIFTPLVYEDASVYFELCMCIVFQTGVVYTLSAFFIAIGKTYYVTVGAVIANIINMILSIILILGIDGLIPAMGIKGAAWAQIISEFLEGIYLFAIFWSRQYKKTYGTRDFRFRPDIFWSCIKIGVPASLNHLFEMSAWSMIAYLLSAVGFVHMTVYSVFQAIFVFFAHIVSGMEKGLSTLVANAIGAKEYDRINQSLFQGFKLLVVVACIVLLPIVLNPNILLGHFLCDIPAQSLGIIKSAVEASLFWILIYALLDGIAWLMAGILTAAGDTRFLMTANIFNVWSFAVLPVYLTTYFGVLPPEHTWTLQCLYAFLSIFIMAWRYRGNSWRKIHII